MLAGQFFGEQRTGKRAPRHVRRGAQRLQGLLDVRELGAGDRRLQVFQAALECKLAIRRAQVVGDRRDRAPVQVEPALGIAAGGEEEERPPRGAVNLVLGEEDATARDRG